MIWGLTAEGTADVDWKFALAIDGKQIAVELFRHTAKILPVTGLRLDAVEELANIDKGSTWALAWGDRREAQAAEAALPTKPASAPEPKPKPAADVSEKPAPEPAPKPAPAAPASRACCGDCGLSQRRRYSRHAAPAQSSIAFPTFDLSEMTTIDLAELIDEPVPANRKICCPFHAETKPSLHIYPDHYYCFGCHAYGDHIDWLMQIKGLDHTAAQERADELDRPGDLPSARRRRAPHWRISSRQRRTGPMSCAGGTPPSRSEARSRRRYLAETRGIDLDLLPDNVDDVLRFHPRCVFGPGVKHPCLIALMRDACGDAPIGIQRIALTPDAQKIDRRMLGLPAW